MRRDLSHIDDATVHLIVTSPPYWTLKEYPKGAGQLGAVEDYEAFLDELDKVWRECARVLVPGGRVCCVVGDVCVPRRRLGRHFVMPLHADIQVRSRACGLDALTPIHWHKIANGVTEAKGNGAGFYGKPYQPGAVVKNDVEYILFLRKGGEYRKVTALQKALSMLTREEMQSWWQPAWIDIRGASTRQGHPAPYPSELAGAADPDVLVRGGYGAGSVRWGRAARVSPRSARAAELLGDRDRCGLRGDRRKKHPQDHWQAPGDGSRPRGVPRGTRGRASAGLRPERLDYRLLDTFRGLFEGQLYRHRSSKLGDFVAMQLYEDLYARSDVQGDTGPAWMTPFRFSTRRTCAGA